MRPYDRKVPFLGTKIICEQFDLHTGLLSRWRQYTGIDNRKPDERGPGRGTGNWVKMSGCEVWQLLSFLDITGYVPGLPAGASPSQVKSLEWLWRPVLNAIETQEVGWVAATPQHHMVSPLWYAEEDVAEWAMAQPFVMIYKLKPPVSLTEWLTMRWVETNP